MIARSGVFIKYVIEFVGADLTVSNDPSVGDFALDADVTVTMARGTLGTTFKITLYDLPLKRANVLSTVAPALRTVKVSLGYFEIGVKPVMEGIYAKVESKTGADKTFGQDKLVTTISGNEAALVACSETKYTASLSDEDAFSFAKAAQSVLSSVFLADNINTHPGFDLLVDKKVQFNTPVTVSPLSRSDTKFNNDTVLTVLAEIAKKARLELLIVDKMVILGSPIARRIDPAQLDPSTNLAKIETVKLAVKPETSAGKSNPPKETPVKIFSFTALGDPTMRPGQPIIVSGIEGSAVKGIDEITGTAGFVIRSVEHQFNSSTGYVCVGAAASGLKDGAAALDVDSAIKQNAATGAQDVATAIKSEAAKNPVVEVTSVKAPADAYQADLYHGQPREDEQQPSIEVAIEQQEDHVYKHRPIASPFAWRKCGLVTPVYPVMKAVVAHNQGLATDGIVTGYIWSKLPDLPPPPNKDGDWWLCLPIDFDVKKVLPPGQTKSTDGKTFDWKTFNWSKFDQTKAVNDLTGQTGKRVIEVKGLKITVGAAKLAAVGTRPTEGPDDDFLIEHASGTTVHIDSKGALTIDASKASLTIKGDVVIEGSLEIK